MDNKEIARRFVEEHNQAQYVAVHDELLADGCVMHLLVGGMPPQVDREAHKQLIAMFRGALPDIRDTVEDVIAEGDKVAVRWHGTGTHSGTALLDVPAAGKHVEVDGFYLFRMENGKIAESWMNFDLAGLLQQLGAMPGPEAATA